MSTIRLDELLGRKVRDVDGRVVGRIEELRAEIELHPRTADYVVVEVYVGAYRLLEPLASSHFGRHMLRLLSPPGWYVRYHVPWEVIDFSDPVRPRVSKATRELRRSGKRDATGG